MRGVKSSNIESVGFDPDKQTMAVRFKNGGFYEYEGVSQSAHDALVNADSVGAHFHANIRGKFKHKAVG